MVTGETPGNPCRELSVAGPWAWRFQMRVSVVVVAALASLSWPLNVMARPDRPVHPGSDLVKLSDGRYLSVIDSTLFVVVGAPDSAFYTRMSRHPHNLFPPQSLEHGFLLGAQEVSIAQYRAFRMSTGRAVSAQDLNDDKPVTDPITGLTWDEIELYCGWAHARLPTAAEWEYAALGPDDRRFPWGDAGLGPELAALAPGSGEVGALCSVDSCQAGASWVGALNMLGNAGEACLLYAPDKLLEFGLHPSRNRVVKGGSVADSVDDVNRVGMLWLDRRFDEVRVTTGFRLCRDLPSSP